MGKAFARLIQWLMVLTLVMSSLVPTAGAREDQAAVTEAVAWLEDGEVRIQIEYSFSPDEAVLAITQGEWEKTRIFRKTSRLSVAVTPVSNESMDVVLTTSSKKGEQQSRWEIELPKKVETVEKGEVRKADWDKKASRKKNQLEMVIVEDGIPSEEEEPADREPEEEANEDASQLEDLAKEFYEKYADGEKPTEADLRSSRVVFEMEPNDTMKKADWLFDKQDAFGKIGKSGDEDYWKIRATENGIMNVSLRDIPYQQNYQLYVFDADGRELGRSELAGDADETIEGVGVERREWYYVMVRGEGSSHNPHLYYRLRIDFQSAQGEIKPDEYEPNNSIADAYDLGDEQSLTANLHSLKDVDFYRFSLKRTSTVIVRLGEIPNGMDMDLYLLDEKGKTIGRSERSKNVNEEIASNIDAGTYVIKVMAARSSGFTANSYKLSLETHTIPVILIPGIGGSRLEVEEHGIISEAWLAIGRTVLPPYNDPQHRRVLSLMPVDGKSVEVKPRTKGIRVFPERANEGFSAIEYLTYSDAVPTAHEKSEQYASMVKELKKQGYVQHRTLFAMPYDWRYSSADNAKYLKEKIDVALRNSKAQQVHLVAHSMGGLLVRETLLSNPSYQPKVNRVIYMGTPFLGSPRAYQAIKFGYDFGIVTFLSHTGKIIAEYAPAVYELLPSKQYVSNTPFLWKNQKEHYTYQDLTRVKHLQLTYEPLVHQAGKLHEIWDNRQIKVPQYSIIGQGHSTLLGYFVDPKTEDFIPYYDNQAGDGTVPYDSANYSLKDIKKKYYVNGEHAALPRIPQVIHQVINLLNGNDKASDGVRSSAAGNFDYLYYIIRSEDGSFPSVTIQKNGREMTIGSEPTEWREDLSIEYHGKVVVVHVLDKQPLSFQLPEGANLERPSTIKIRRFSSEDPKRYREEGRPFILGPDGFMEEDGMIQ
ncbi:lipase/acyltransferase domain-containing protein [Brevibacillus panacihumi]|uniref:Esterase n=1 Tax=Brevibacillus panacihumi TaxID=497735 RepID=A0A3M8CFF0_9BACL|nr:pre-peptidase C-terminal domain-containing protein [Brevibacillus panacihumi]RNB74474.1 esterase [Brevibacillus panacihumi]